MRIGVAAIARPTFDTGFAAETASAAFERLGELGWELTGSAELLMGTAAVGAAVAELGTAGLDGLVILQASFTDSTLVTPFAAVSMRLLVLWAFPEDRTGERLRLNSLCGMNLAGFALRAAGARYNYLYRAPSETDTARHLREAMTTELQAKVPVRGQIDDLAAGAREAAERVLELLERATIGVIGDHPNGFEPCAYDAARLSLLGGISVERIELGDIFDRANSVAPELELPVRALVGERLTGADDVHQAELGKAVRLHLALDAAATEHGWSGLAMRCWPECFTDYGSAACAAQAMLSDRGLPGCCEADVYGNLTSLVLQCLADGPAFVADLVELDRSSDTGVLWHCGIAPYALADADAVARATVHSNRVKPLLHEFPLKPGRVTLARFSQAGREHSLIIGGGVVMRAPISFSGTSGVVRFDASVGDVLATIMGNGLEHHYGLVYGDVRDELRALAALLDIPIIELASSL